MLRFCSFQLDSCLKHEVFGFELGLFHEVFGFTLGRLHDLRGLVPQPRPVV